MGYDLRLPNVTGATEKEKVVQIERYLRSLVEQLQWALNNIDASNQNVVSSTPKSLTPSNKPAVDANSTFNAIKHLIIKSADIVEAYHDEINKRLVGEYLAQSDFGVFKEQTVQDIEANSQWIKQNFDDVQEILADIENLNYTLAEVNTHIKSGLLYRDENGLPVFGLEIGQKNTVDGKEVFNKYARFTSNRLTFYDQNDTEVAYISDYKIYITHAEITGSIKLGGFLVDTTNGITFRWVGRG